MKTNTISDENARSGRYSVVKKWTVEDLQANYDKS